MKKHPICYHYLFLAVIPIFLYSCKTGTTSSISHQDSLKIIAWDKIFKGSKPHKPLIDTPVEASLAEDCLLAYQKMYGTLNPAAMQKAYTYAVGFQSDSLSGWLTSVTTDPNIKMNNIRVCFGVYTQKFVDAYPVHAKDLGRLTVFLWPYLGDQPAQYTVTPKGKLTGGGGPVNPFNLGSLYP